MKPSALQNVKIKSFCVVHERVYTQNSCLNSETTYLQNGQTLAVTQAWLSDEGRYKCVAENVAGEMEMLTDVIIQGQS